MKNTHPPNNWLSMHRPFKINVVGLRDLYSKADKLWSKKDRCLIHLIDPLDAQAQKNGIDGYSVFCDVLEPIESFAFIYTNCNEQYPLNVWCCDSNNQKALVGKLIKNRITDEEVFIDRQGKKIRPKPKLHLVE